MSHNTITLTRSLTQFERTQDNNQGLTITGIAVPFGEVINLMYERETFARNCVFEHLNTAKITLDHGNVIGCVTAYRTTEDGLEITCRISNTMQGRDVAIMIADGALDSMSIGFVPIDDEVIDGDIVCRTRVRVLEIAITGIPAYQGATITNQRNQTERNPSIMTNSEPNTLEKRVTTMEEETRSAIADIVKRLDAKHEPSTLGGQYRSAGDYLKALAHGENEATELMKQSRDLITSQDVHNTNVWINDMIHLVQSRRSIANLFQHQALPDKGMTLEYLTLGTDSMKVTRQSSEGTRLQYGEITLASTSAQINLYGGYTSLSRQVIERSTSPALTTALRALTIAYSQAIETACREYLEAVLAAAEESNKLTVKAAPSAMNTAQWIDTIIDLAEAVDSRGASIGTLVVSKDVFKALSKLTLSGNALMDLSGKGSNTLGSIDLTGVTGTLLRVPVMMLPSANFDGDIAAAIDPEALTLWESGGPLQLQQQDAVGLTNDYSVYGYAAMGNTFPGGVTVLKNA